MDQRKKIAIVVVAVIVVAALAWYFMGTDSGTSSGESVVKDDGNTLLPYQPAPEKRPAEEILKTLRSYKLVGTTGQNPVSSGFTAREVVSLSKCQNMCSMDPACTGIMHSMPNDFEYPSGSCFTISIPIDQIPLSPEKVADDEKGKYARLLYRKV